MHRFDLFFLYRREKVSKDKQSLRKRFSRWARFYFCTICRLVELENCPKHFCSLFDDHHNLLVHSSPYLHKNIRFGPCKGHFDIFYDIFVVVAVKSIKLTVSSRAHDGEAWRNIFFCLFFSSDPFSRGASASKRALLLV